MSRTAPPGHWSGVAGVTVLVLGLGAAALAPGAAFGQTPPTPLAPNVGGNTVPQGNPIPRVLPPTPPTVGGALPAIPPATPSPNLPQISVPVRSVAVSGATAYPEARLTPLTAGLTGASVPLARVEAARLALLNLYRGDGFVLTTVTAAVDDAGNLRFTVVEGRIADVKLDGDIGPAGVQVLRFLHHLTEQRPIDTATLERWLLLAQDIPGVTIHAVLQPSTEDPGALTLVAQVDRQRVNGLVTFDNRAFRLTGPQEALGVVDFNSFTQFGERTELSLYKTAGNTQTFGQGSFETFVGGSGLRIRLYAGTGEATPSEYLRAVGYKGFTTTFGISGSYPIIRSRQQTLNVSTNLDAIESEIRTNTGANNQAIRTSRDSLRVARVGLDYALQDVIAGGTRGAVNTAYLRLSEGLAFLGGTDRTNPTPGRVGEKLNFTKIAGEVVRTQTLLQPWSGASVALKGLLAFQYSGDILPPAEKFFLGGTELTRGFFSGQASGDSAIAYTFELQLNTSMNFNLFQRPFDVAAQFYTFYDHGNAYQSTRAEPNITLSSEGLGVRVNLTRYTEFDLEGVIRNTRLPQGTPGAVKSIKADALFWRVLGRF